jgi:hypothetical protein
MVMEITNEFWHSRRAHGVVLDPQPVDLQDSQRMNHFSNPAKAKVSVG